MEATQQPPDPKFEDGARRTWTIALDYGLLRKIRDAHRVDLGKVDELARTWAGLLFDDALALRVVWTTIQEQAAAVDVSLKDFESAMDGPRLEAATTALEGAIVSFTQPRKRGLTTSAIQGVTAGMKRAIAQAESDVANKILEKTEEALAALGKSPPESPA